MARSNSTYAQIITETAERLEPRVRAITNGNAALRASVNSLAQSLRSPDSTNTGTALPDVPQTPRTTDR